MKKEYMKPTINVVRLQSSAILAGSGEGVYGDESASGSSQLSRRSGWDDEYDE
jgi:hypothetical protein